MRLHACTDPRERDFVAAWTAARIPAMQNGHFGQCSAMAIIDGAGQIVAGIVFHEFNAQFKSISMSIAADTAKWLSPGIISGILYYPFGQAACQRVTAVTAPRESATSIWQFLLKFGFQHEGRVRKGLGDVDAHVWGLLETEWRTNRYNIHRAVEHKKRRRRRGTLRLEAHALN